MLIPFITIPNAIATAGGCSKFKITIKNILRPMEIAPHIEIGMNANKYNPNKQKNPTNTPMIYPPTIYCSREEFLWGK